MYQQLAVTNIGGRLRSQANSCTKEGFYSLSAQGPALPEGISQSAIPVFSGVTATSGGYTLSGKAVSDLCRIAVGVRANQASGGSASWASAQLV